MEKRGVGHLRPERKLEQVPRASYTKLWDPASMETEEAVSGGVLEDVRAAV